MSGQGGRGYGSCALFRPGSGFGSFLLHGLPPACSTPAHTKPLERIEKGIRGDGAIIPCCELVRVIIRRSIRRRSNKPGSVGEGRLQNFQKKKPSSMRLDGDQSSIRKGGEYMSDDNTSTNNSQSMYTNTDLALKLKAERRRVCGILGEGSDPAGLCPVIKECRYAIEDKGGNIRCCLGIAFNNMLHAKPEEESR